MKLVIFHGTYGHAGENWFPWLSDKMKGHGWECHVPTLPTPDNQTHQNWVDATAEQLGDFIDANTVLIGHSSGGSYILNYLDQNDVVIRGAGIVAAPIYKIGQDDIDRLNETFFDQDLNWVDIKEKIGLARLFYSDNDPYVPLSQGEDVAAGLGLPLDVDAGAGHFNSAAGYDTFPDLYDWLVQNFK